MNEIKENAPLPLIDGYVIEVSENDGQMSINTGERYDYVLPSDYVAVTFHDALGNECYLFVPGPESDDEEEED